LYFNNLDRGEDPDASKRNPSSMSTADGSDVPNFWLGSAYIQFTGDRLVVGNEHFRRVWRVGDNGLLSAESFRDTKTGGEWLSASSQGGAPTPATELPEEVCTITIAPVPSVSAVEAESLTAELTATGSVVTLVYRLQIFPGASGVRMNLAVRGATTSATAKTEATVEAGPTGIEQDPVSLARDASAAVGRDILEALTLAPVNLRLTQVTFQDQTDHHNELVAEHEWLLHPAERSLSLSGCLFYVEDVVTGAGLIFLKEAPLPYARSVPSELDLRVER
jgi:alpha-galactosidase